MITFSRLPKPRREIAAVLRVDSGGLNTMPPFFSTPSGAVTTTASAWKVRCGVCTATPVPQDRISRTGLS